MAFNTSDQTANSSSATSTTFTVYIQKPLLYQDIASEDEAQELYGDYKAYIFA